MKMSIEQWVVKADANDGALDAFEFQRIREPPKIRSLRWGRGQRLMRDSSVVGLLSRRAVTIDARTAKLPVNRPTE